MFKVVLTEEEWTKLISDLDVTVRKMNQPGKMNPQGKMNVRYKNNLLTPLKTWPSIYIGKRIENNIL